MCNSRKYPYSPHRRDWNFLGGGWVGGSVWPKNLKKSMKLNWNFQRGWAGLGKMGAGMDIFWNLDNLLSELLMSHLFVWTINVTL